MTEPTHYTPPLPTLTGTTPAPVANPPANEWRLLVESVAVHAQPPRYVVGKTSGYATASPFRTGTIAFSEEGIKIEGMARQLPPRWFALVSALSALPYLLGNILSTYIGKMGVPPTIRFASFFIGLPFLFLPALIRNRLDKRRTETITVLAWKSVRGLQVDPQLRFVTLVFSSVAVPAKPVVFRLLGKKPEPPPALPAREFLTLNQLEPAIVAGVVATVEHYAPHVRRDSAGLVHPVAHWITIVLLSVVGLGLFVFIVSTFIAVWRLQHSIIP